MAEAFAAALLTPLGITVASAGLTPTKVCPWAIRVMAEVGLDIAPQTSKSVDRFDPDAVDTLVLVEEGLAMPARFSALRPVEWRLTAGSVAPCPPDTRLEAQRRMRNRVERLVFHLIAGGAIGRPRNTAAATSAAKP